MVSIQRRVCWVACVGILLVGCGEPQLTSGNLRLTMSLRTAVSARNMDWLEMNAALIEERRQSGNMRDGEYAAFSRILEDARSGEWAKAEKAVVRLQEAQRPTGRN